MTLTRFWQLLTARKGSPHVVGTTPEVGRTFLRCTDCRRIVPFWRCVAERGYKGARGCACGGQTVKSAWVTFAPAAWWVLVRGIVIRKWILRVDNWDPRMPVRQGEYF